MEIQQLVVISTKDHLPPNLDIVRLYCHYHIQSIVGVWMENVISVFGIF